MLDFLCRGTDTTCSAPVLVAQVLTCVFLAILFLQSGIDKVVDRAGNVEWLTGHFASSPLAGMVPWMLTTVTVTELAAGACATVGAVFLLLGLGAGLAIAACLLSAISLTMLFFGQRMAKDYAGAAVLVPYFLVTIAGLALLG